MSKAASNTPKTTSSDNQLSISEFIPALVLLLLLIGVYYPIIHKVYVICDTNEDYSHGLFLPFFSAFLIWTKKEEIFSAYSKFPTISSKAKYGGILLIVIGLFGAVVGAASDILFPSWVSLFVTLCGILLISLPRKLLLIIAPTLLLNYMAFPLPGSLIPWFFNRFQVMAAKASAWTLELLGVPVFLQGNIIEIPHMRLMVEQACSGMRSMVTLLTVAIIVIQMRKFRWYNGILLLIISTLTAIGFNVIRVVATGLLSHFVGPHMARGFAHEFTGIVTFVGGLFVIFFLSIPISTPIESTTKNTSEKRELDKATGEENE